MRPRTLAAAMAVFVLASIHGAPALGQETLRLSSWVPPSHILVRDALIPWAEEVEEATGGSLKIDILKTPVGKPPAHFDIALDGLADITYGVHGYTPGRFVLTQAVELPFQSDSAEALSVAFWRVHEQIFATANEHRGVHLLGLWTHGPGQIFNAQRPITSVTDFEGLKFRVGGGLVSRISELLGTVQVSAPATKAYELLSNGVADGIFFPSESIPFFNLVDLVPHATLVPGGLYNSSFFLIMNQARWDSLTPEQQETVTSLSGEALARRIGQAWDAGDVDGLSTMRAAGSQVIGMDDAFLAQVRDRLAPLEADWIERAVGREVDGTAALAALRREIADAR